MLLVVESTKRRTEDPPAERNTSVMPRYSKTKRITTPHMTTTTSIFLTGGVKTSRESPAEHQTDTVLL